ncbi:CBO0543 family protein [Neobacillus sp. FSL H8-0543]|uniref:CBO0543 family protein n=1 Tax=Neobacillus sp. FSL H8-0543 TaxID=2954672 RepID=UPI0031598895
MLIERLILIAMWPIGIVAFILFIPLKDRRNGLLALLMFQAIIWLCDMFAFKYGLLSAPVRELPKATDLPLTINYFFYPVLFSIFYVRKKANSSLLPRITYFLIWISAGTLFDIVIERNTDLLNYEKSPWYGMWIYIGFLFFVTQVCCNWFFKDKALFQAERWKTNEN